MKLERKVVGDSEVERGFTQLGQFIRHIPSYMQVAHLVAW